MSDDPFDSKEFLAYAKRVRVELIPKIRDSALTISIAPSDGQGDVKFATELGFSILLNKPIIVVAEPGTPISPALAKVAYRVIFADFSTPNAQAEISTAINDLVIEFDLDHRDD